MSNTRVIIIRHGETLWNVEGRYQGHLNSPLTEDGLAQARAVGQRLRRHTFSTLYSSDLGRAQQTAGAIAEATGHAIRLESGLRELNLGQFQGYTRAEAQARWPEDHAKLRSGLPDYVAPQGESNRQMQARVTATLTELARRHPDETVVVVTHGGVLSSFLRQVLGLPLEAPRRFARVNASWNVFSFSEGKWMLETWGDTEHLGDGYSRDDL